MSISASQKATILRSAFALGLSMTLLGCQDGDPQSKKSQTVTRSGLTLQQMIAENNTGDQNKEIIKGVEALRSGDYRTATQSFNMVLVDDPLNAGVHALNGYAYHLMGKSGDVSKMDLALAGYQQALNIDPDNTFAAMQLGRIYADKEEFLEAQEHFSKVLLEEPDNDKVFYEMSAVSYKMGDLRSAKASIDQALTLQNAQKDYLRAGAVIYAALGQHKQADVFLKAYLKLETNRKQRNFVKKRVEDWEHLYQTNGVDVPQEFTPAGKMLLTSMTAPAGGSQGAAKSDLASPPPAKKSDKKDASSSDDTSSSDASGDSGSSDASSSGDGSDPNAGSSSDSGSGSGSGSSSGSGSDSSGSSSDASSDDDVEDVPLMANVPTLAQKIAKSAPSEIKVPQSTTQDGVDDMVVIDVVVMRVSENGGTSKGSNILENFTMTLSPFNYFRGRYAQGGMSSGSVVPLNNDTSSAINIAPSVTSLADNKNGGVANVISQAISFGNVQYSLNIANAQRQFIEVIGRPTLTTKIGKEATFFSGTNFNIALSGQFGGNVSSTPYGFTLKVTPESLQDDVIDIKVRVDGSSFVQNDSSFVSNSSSTAETFSILSSNVETNVRLRLGETIILGGIAERTDTSNKTGFPFLMDIPGVQYLFSNETTSLERRSVVYMLTPRSHKRNMKEIRRFFANGGDFGNRPTLTKLEKRHKDWFDPPSAQLFVMEKLWAVYDQFKIGDLKPLRWSDVEGPDSELEVALEFLWY